MCRIAGIANPTLPFSVAEEKVRKMCQLQQHGGPDDEGVYACMEHNIILGHRRLALIDLSPSGHQPMIYNNRYVISFNGEIYNFPELKNQLQQMGWQFHTECDTEVILAAFAQWNTHSFHRLRGMFAFALYDKAEQTIYLVRDPSGIKPLYYSTIDKTLQFSSEIRAFNVFQNKKANQHWPVYQLAYGHLPEPVTTFSNIQPLHKGCFLKYNLSTRNYSYQSFTHYSYSNQLKDVDVTNDTLNRALYNAVGRHLLSDAPIGVFLSGGLDSSIVSILAAAFQQQHLKTLSIYFDEPDFSEKKYQDLIIQKLKCNFYQHLLSADEFHASFPDILQAMDMPSCDGVNTWFISKYARRQGLKAVLSGIGSDELFGGYPSFQRMNIAYKMQKLSGSATQLLKNSRMKMISRIPYLSLEGTKGLYLFLRGQFVPVQIARHLDATEKEIWNILREHPMPVSVRKLSDKNKASWIELNLYMQNQLLRDADVMGMAHGVEIRVPFLDDEVVTTALSVDASLKYNGSVPKQILINLFKHKLPEPVWKREKMGFSFPFTQWMAQSEFVKDMMQQSNRSSRDSYKKFLEGQLHWSHLMSLLILQVRGMG